MVCPSSAAVARRLVAVGDDPRPGSERIRFPPAGAAAVAEQRALSCTTMAEQLYLENIDEFVTDQNKIVRSWDPGRQMRGVLGLPGRGGVSTGCLWLRGTGRVGTGHRDAAVEETVPAAEPLAGSEVRGPRAGEWGAGRGAREAGRAREASSPLPCRVLGPSSPECAVQETRRLSGLLTPGGLSSGKRFLFRYI